MYFIKKSLIRSNLSADFSSNADLFHIFFAGGGIRFLFGFIYFGVQLGLLIFPLSFFSAPVLFGASEICNLFSPLFFLAGSRLATQKKSV